MLVNYQAAPRTTLRLLANRRVTTPIGTLLAPLDTLFSVEGETLPHALPNSFNNGQLSTYEVDFEHYLQGGRLLKVFAFHAAGRNLLYDVSRYFDPNDVDRSGFLANNFLPFDRLRRSGVGARFETPLGRSLFGQAGFAFNRTIASAQFYNPMLDMIVPAIYTGQQAPYHPRTAGLLGLNYVSPGGLKLGLTMNYSGPFFQDTDDVRLTTRSRFGSHTTFDLLLSREATVKNEFYVEVFNLLDSRQVVYNGVSFNQRRLNFGIRRRF